MLLNKHIHQIKPLFPVKTTADLWAGWGIQPAFLKLPQQKSCQPVLCVERQTDGRCAEMVLQFCREPTHFPVHLQQARRGH